MSELKITIVEPDALDNYSEEDGGFTFKHPSKYYFVNALGQSIYIHTRDMKVAVQYVKEHYDGKYTIRTTKESKGSSEYTCTGSNSRKGFASHLRPTV